ncbi:hypothetical protein MN032_11140 [Agromyces atrinae]|uniref:hypothetical protein n=1 Tax=Agromyces atrinae TaxID=592376 RepID=UPI001F5831F4|nr:hypothetical protein [Agromyces atrinae]MCI2958253.1 hypothetical protein [Agromyces atrinae]
MSTETTTKAEDDLERKIADDELLEDLPELRAPHKLRVKHRNAVWAILLDSGLMEQSDEASAKSVKKYVDGYKLDELRTLATERGIEASGSKSEIAGRLVDNDEETGTLDLSFDFRDSEELKRLKDLMGVAAAVDEFAESIALDKEAYIEWAEGKDMDVFFAILNRYSSAVGESGASAN